MQGTPRPRAEAGSLCLTEGGMQKLLCYVLSIGVKASINTVQLGHLTEDHR